MCQNISEYLSSAVLTIDSNDNDLTNEPYDDWITTSLVK